MPLGMINIPKGKGPVPVDCGDFVLKETAYVSDSPPSVSVAREMSWLQTE